jgi:hypothetical protein
MLARTLKKTAKKLINQFGNDLTLKQITEGAYNPATGQPALTIVTVVTKGIDEDIISGEHEGDMTLTFVSDTVLDAFDKAVYRGKERDILAISQVAIQNSTIIYQAIVTGDAKVQV